MGAPLNNPSVGLMGGKVLGFFGTPHNTRFTICKLGDDAVGLRWWLGRGKDPDSLLRSCLGYLLVVTQKYSLRVFLLARHIQGCCAVVAIDGENLNAKTVTGCRKVAGNRGSAHG